MTVNEWISIGFTVFVISIVGDYLFYRVFNKTDKEIAFGLKLIYAMLIGPPTVMLLRYLNTIVLF